MPKTDPIIVPFEAEDNLTDKSGKIKETIQNIGVVLASIVGSAKAVTQAMSDVAEAVLKRPELFTEEEVRRAENFAKANEEVSNSLNHLALEVMPVVTSNLAALADLPGAFEAIKSGTLDDWAAGIVNAALGVEEAVTGMGESIVEGGRNQISMMEQIGKASDEQTAKIVYNNLLQKLSVDGITEAEMEMAIGAGLALGIFDEKSAETAMRINELTTQVIEGKISVEELGAAVNNLPTHHTINVDISATGATELLGIAGRSTPRSNRRQHGGQVAPSNTYVVGEAGPEIFRPHTAGSIIPNNAIGAGGGGINEGRLARKIATSILKGLAQQ